jgi:hypothetical protein
MRSSCNARPKQKPSAKLYRCGLVDVRYDPDSVQNSKRKEMMRCAITGLIQCSNSITSLAISGECLVAESDRH